MIGLEARSVAAFSAHELPTAVHRTNQYSAAHKIGDSCLNFLRIHDDYMSSFNNVPTVDTEDVSADCTDVSVRGLRGVAPLLARERAINQDARFAPLVEIGSVIYGIIGIGTVVCFSTARRMDEADVALHTIEDDTVIPEHI